MGRRTIVAWVALAGACGGGSDEHVGDAGSTDATPTDAETDAAVDAAAAQFDLDLVVHPAGVQAWMSGPLGDICNPMDSYPQPDACADRGDVFVCGLDTCLERVAIERGGVELAAGSLDRWWWVIDAAVPDAFAGGDVDLVIEGCGGGTWRVALGRGAAAPAPTLTDLHHDGGYLRGTVTGATGASGITAYGDGMIAGTTCHEAGASALRWPTEPGPWTTSLDVRAIASRPVVSTPWGEARIWITTPTAEPTPIVLVGSDALGRTLGTVPAGTTTLTVDSEAPASIRPELGLHATPAGARLHLTGAVTYTAGETTDTLALDRPDGHYAATFAHVTPANDLDLSFDGDRRVELTVGPVTLTHETDPARTLSATVDLAWDHPVVPRPEP